MVKETPSFFSQPLPEEPAKPKRRVVRKRAAATPRTRRTSKTDALVIDTQKISRQLDDIYRDESGRIPDMRQIKIKKEGKFFKKFFTFIIVVGLLAAAAWTGFFLMPNKKFADTQVNVSVNGPENVVFGATSTYEIMISNQQKINIKNIVLTVRYPESFIFATSSISAANQGNNEWSLGNLAGNKDTKLQISGIYYGALNQEQSWRVSASYKPENFNSEMQRSAVKTTRITRSPYSLTITGPDKIAVGNEIEYVITLEDREGKPDQKFVIQNEWPTNFYPTSSTPALEKNNSWTFVNTSPTSTTSTVVAPILPIKQVFSVKGKFSDSDQKDATLKSSLLFTNNKNNYKIGESTISTELTKNSVSLDMAINGSIEKIITHPAEGLNVTITAKNESKEKLTKATVNIYFDAPAYKKQSVIDWAKIADSSDGDVVGKQISDTIRQGKITWNSSKLNTLGNWKQGQEVQFNFQVPLKDTKTIDWSMITENKIIATPEVVFTDATGAGQTITGKPIEIIINSDFNLEVRDEIENTASKENHNITWIINNTVHPLKNITLTADLYGDVTVTEPIAAPAGKVNYDKTAKKIIWTIEQMNESTDVLALPFTVTLNTKNPTQNLLVSKIRVQAEDITTGEKLEIMGEEVPLKTE